MKLLPDGQAMRAGLVSITMLAGGLFTSAAAQPLTAVLPLGDSITQANDSHDSYRYPLWKKLVDHGVPFDLVGSMDTNFWGNPEWPPYANQTFDPDHEGHWGWEAREILAGRAGEGDISTWLSGYTPDIVLMHLGTNDVLRGRSVPDTVTVLETIIDLLRTDNPEVVIVLAQLIPTTDSLGGQLPALNQEMEGIATRKTMASSPVVVVDQYSGFNTATDLYDPWHPNAAGEEKMAVKWFQILRAGPLARLDLMAAADGAYGNCLTTQPGAALPSHVDSENPLPGQIFFYLVEVESFNTAWGQGRSSTGRIRRPGENCP